MTIYILEFTEHETTASDLGGWLFGVFDLHCKSDETWDIWRLRMNKDSFLAVAKMLDSHGNTFFFGASDAQK